MKHLLLRVAGLFLGVTVSLSGAVVIDLGPGVATGEFAVQAITEALAKRGEQVERARPGAPEAAAAARIVFVTGPDSPAIPALQQAGGAPPGEIAREGFALRRTGTAAAPTIWIVARDPGGVLYGGLEVAEQIQIGGLAGVTACDRAPHFAMRGVKFNLPLDVRTPSYTDMSDSAQANIATVWDFNFWSDYLDTLARLRYNYVSLWNLHPFPSLVRVPEYPDIALDDVQRSTIAFAEDYSTRTEDIVTPAMLAQVETVRTLSIDEKIEFWRRVMAYARDRNIDFYFVTWNIYTFGTGGRHGITTAIDNPVTADYFRKSVAALFRTYPLLRGIGVTAGENMGTHNASFEAKEDWLFATYGQGVLDVANEQPGRPIRFIHRQHETRAADIVERFAPLVLHPDIEFLFSFKYAQAHALSSTTQTFHRGYVESLGAVKTLWTLRNDDALMLRWGAPDFVREFITTMPRDVSQGIYYGSDMWVWGREFLDRAPSTPRQLEIDKHWFHWMLWGRLGYEPTLDNERIAALLGLRFPGVDAPALLQAWQHASMTYPLTTGFHWGQFDFQWYIEGCRSRPGPAQTASGFHDVNRFITLAPHPGTDNIAIPRYVDGSLAGKEFSGTAPEVVANRLHEHAHAARTTLARIVVGDNPELQRTVADIRAMALLGDYYGHKIAGATQLQFFRRSGRAQHRERAVDELTQAAEVWRSYTELLASQYTNPLWTNRVGIVDWQELNAEVANDIEIARTATAEPPPN